MANRDGHGGRGLRAAAQALGRWRLWAAAGGVFLALFAAWRMVPLPRFEAPYAAVAYDSAGGLLSAVIADDDQWRFPPGAALPEKYVAAVIHYEDRRFFRHPGVDPLAVVRALWQNLRAGTVVSGASTLTMQVARLSRPPQPRQLAAKLMEAAMAVKMEAVFSKADILRAYAANAPFGGNVVGLEAAAWRYFGRTPARLSWAEAAMLAVLPNQPSLIHPGRNRRALKAKRDRLLVDLQRSGRIDRLTCRLARAEPLPSGPLEFPRLAPHLLTTLSNRSRTASATHTGGRKRMPPRFATTIDSGLQRQSTAVVQRHHRRLAQNGIRNLAALIVDVPSGRVLAYVGNAGDGPGAAVTHGSQVDVVPAPRSSGSILKPFLYAAMLDAGALLPNQLVADIPTRLGGFQPQNYTRTYQGAVPAAQALARSLNVPTVRMLQRFGVGRFHRTLEDWGMGTLSRPADHYGLSLILGGAEVTLWDTVGMYAGLARAAGGDLDGFGSPRVLDAAPASGNRDAVADPGASLSPAAAWLTLEAMTGVDRPEADRQWRRFSSSRRLAWKTGTSYGFRDGWAVGVTPATVVGVWAGNADGEGRAGLTGLTAAAPVLFDLIALVPDAAGFAPPDDLVAVTVCRHSGYLAGPSCADRRTEQVPSAGRRGAVCPYCRTAVVDADSRWQVHARCASMADTRQIRRFHLPPAMAWYYRQGRADYRPVPPYRPDCLAMLAETGTAAINFISPGSVGAVYIPLELDSRLGRVVFEAAHRDPDATIFWHLDDRYLGKTRHIHQMPLAPSPGRHRVTLVDADGAAIQRDFVALSRVP